MKRTEGILSEWRKDRAAFRKSQRRLEDGRIYGDSFAPFQEEIFLKLQDPINKKSLLVLPRGADKTSGAGAWFPLETLILEEGAEIVVVGTDSDVGVLNLREMHGYCERNPLLDAMVRRNKNEITTRTGRITVLSSDAASSYGLKPTLVICDEFSHWWTLGHEQLFWSLFSSIAKRGGRIVILSNAGAAFSKLYFQVREKIEADHKSWFVYAPSNLKIPWIADAELDAQKSMLPPDQYARLFANVDCPNSGNFVSLTDLERCIDNDHRPTEKGDPEKLYFLGCDYGRKHDRTAIACVHMGDDGLIVLDDVWHAKGNRENPVSFGVVESRLLNFAARFNLGGGLADPFQLQNTLEKLRDSVPMSEFVFSAQSWHQLAQTLYHRIHHAKIRLYRDPLIINEILQLQMIETPAGLKFDHQRGGYSDLATALSLAIVACLRSGGNLGEDHLFDPGPSAASRLSAELEDGHNFRSRLSPENRRLYEIERDASPSEIESIGTDASDLENYF